MAVSVGNSITENDYNTLRSRVNVLLGSPSGTTEVNSRGYGQTLGSSTVSANSIITAAQWDDLRGDIEKVAVHQTGADPSLTNVAAGDSITAAIFNAYETTVATAEASPFAIDAGQGSTEAGITSQRTTNWNGTINHEFTVTFADANTRKAFFNAGGYIIFSANLAYTGSEAKTLDWQTMLSDAGSMGVNYLEAFNISGTGNVSARGTPLTIGNYDLTGTYQDLFSKGGANPYSENLYKIQGKSSATNSITFNVEFQDNDVGDQAPLDSGGSDGVASAGPVVDEDVKGTITSTIQMFRPTGSNVSVAAPAFANTSTL